jgi:Ala-tRNA(Pro) deacylase
MSGLHRIEDYLVLNHVSYEVVPHAHSASSMETAHTAHIDPRSLAKAVLLECDEGLVAAMLSADKEISLGQLKEDFGEHIHLSDEETIRTLFEDCEPGTMPSLTMAWGIDMVWEDELMSQPALYLETGDHKHLIHIETRDLMTLLSDTPHCHFSKPRRLH